MARTVLSTGVYNNFKAITTYNISRLYATAVLPAVERIAGRDPIRHDVGALLAALPLALAACATTGTASAEVPAARPETGGAAGAG